MWLIGKSRNCLATVENTSWWSRMPHSSAALLSCVSIFAGSGFSLVNGWASTTSVPVPASAGAAAGVGAGAGGAAAASCARAIGPNAIAPSSAMPASKCFICPFP